MLLGIFQLSRIIIITIFEYIYYSTNLPKSRVQMVMVTMMMIMSMMMMMMMMMMMVMMMMMMMMTITNVRNSASPPITLTPPSSPTSTPIPRQRVSDSTPTNSGFYATILIENLERETHTYLDQKTSILIGIRIWASNDRS